MEKDTKRIQIPELTGLRGFAALLIVINHMVLVVPALKTFGLASSTWLCGVSGMSLFFVLSGVVIYYNYAKRLLESPKEGVKGFFLARFARLYPLYVVFILGFFIWNAVSCPSHLPQNVVSLPTFLAGLQSWIYGYINGTELIYLQESANISWSISTEFALYFFFVPLVFLLKAPSFKKALCVLIAAVALQWAYVYAIANFGCLTNWIDVIYPGHPGAVGIYLTYHSPLGRIFEFVSGCAIAMLYLHLIEVGKERFLRAVSICAWVAAAICLGLSVQGVFPNWTPVIVSTGWIFFCAGLPCFGARVFRWKPLVFMGDVSYSAYLLHIVFVIVLRYEGNEISGVMRTIGCFLLYTYLTAWLSFRFFETPARKFIRSLAK